MKTAEATQTTCSYCHKAFKASGIQGHITAKHGYDIWKAQQAAKKVQA